MSEMSRFEVNRFKVVDLINRGVLLEGRYLADTNVHNEDMCGYDIGEYELPYTFFAGDVHKNAVTVTFTMDILFYADGRTELDNFGYMYVTEMLDAEKVGLSDRIFTKLPDVTASIFS